MGDELMASKKRHTFNCIKLVDLSNQSLRFSKTGKYLRRSTLLLNEVEKILLVASLSSQNTHVPLLELTPVQMEHYKRDILQQTGLLGSVCT